MALGNLIAGFVKGGTDQALGQLERRQAAAAEAKKAEMLERLRRETAREMALIEDELKSKDVDDKLSTDDFSAGTRTLRNSKGEVIGTHSLDSSLLEERDLKMQDARLGLDVKRANIDQSRASAENSRAYAAAARTRSLDSNDEDEPKMLVAEYERAFKELKDSGANPAVLGNFQTRFHEGVTERKWDKEQQRAFLNAMRRTFTSEWDDPNGRRQRPLLENYSTANSLLDSKL